ncbi:MAG TPA: NAD(P)-dependent oxidoreductase [Burkholderiales bacterium]|nr:NAD(P)-dependent oxidoreductase [Burkholderiales bacterium]
MAALPQIGWIGAGRMGVPMAGFLLQAGYPLRVYSRTAASRQKLLARGAAEAQSVADCARGADIVFASVSDDAALRDIALGPGGVLANLRPGAVFAETSTVSAEASEQVAQEAARRGIAYLRMPISGNAAQALKGDLTVFVSGPQEAWDRVKPVCERFSRAQIYLGAGEQARVMKLVVNALVYAFAQAMAEALTLGRKAGLDWNAMLDALAQSALASPWLKVKAELMKRRDFTPTMTAPLVLKDIDLMLACARSQQVAMPLTALTRQLMQMLVGEGLGDEDYMAAIKLAEKQAGLPTDRVDRAEQRA